MVGAELVRDRSSREPAGDEASTVVNAMRDRAVLIGSTGPAGNVLKVRPPLVFAREHADVLLTTLDDALRDMANSRWKPRHSARVDTK